MALKSTIPHLSKPSFDHVADIIEGQAIYEPALVINDEKIQLIGGGEEVVL